MNRTAEPSMLRRGSRLIVRSLRAHPGPHAAAMVGAALFVFAAVGGAWVLRWITDSIVVPAFRDGTVERSDMFALIAAVIGVSLLRGIGTVTRRWFLSMAELRTQRDWRRQLLGQYLDLPLRFHRSRSTGELLAHADTDVQMATMVLKPLAFSVSVVLLVFVALLTLLSIHPLMALVAAVLFPTLAFLSRFYTARVEAPSALVQQAVGDVSTVAHESFEGALVVKTLGREAEEVARFRAESEILRGHRIQVGRLRGTFEPLIDALPGIGIIILLLIGSWLVSQGSASTGDLVLAATLFSLLATPLRIVGFFLEEMPKSVVSLDRVDGVLNLETEPTPAPFSAVPEGPIGLSVDNVVVRYGDHHVLDEVSLDVEAGETVALVGATGSGKTTLLEAIAGLIDIESGAVRVGGIDTQALSDDQRAGAVSLVFQESFLFAESVAENVSLGTVGIPAVEQALATARATEFVNRMPSGPKTVVGERGVTLSGGQRQRVALARALARSPRVLLLDDATSAVDPLIESEILNNLQRGLDTTLVIVAHRLSTIMLADRVVYIDNGRVMASGSHEDLLERADYRALVTAYDQADVA